MIIIYKFYIEKGEDLTVESIGKIIRKFNSSVLPELKHSWGYFDGSGQKVMSRVAGDASRPNNRILKNYCSSIVDNFQGYLTGNPITYKDNSDADSNSRMMEILSRNDVINEDTEYLRSALIYGIAYELCYVNEDNEIRFINVNPESCIPVFSDDLEGELEYMISFSPIVRWQDDFKPAQYRVSVYSKTDILCYRAGNDFNDFTLLDAEEHHFGAVPFSIFNLNPDNKPIFDRIISLQDAYNSLISDEVNDFQSFVDAYMVLKNVSADEEDLAQMKQNRTILLDNDSDASYLTKSISDTQIQNLLDNINASIHTISNSPDFSSEEFNSGVSSGIALQFKLVGFNNIASNIQARFTKALKKRFELISSILSLIDSEELDVDIVFTRNLPNNISETVTNINALRGLVSDETLLAQIPFIDDVDVEMERVKAQEAQFLTSSFDNHQEVIEDEEV